MDSQTATKAADGRHHCADGNGLLAALSGDARSLLQLHMRQRVFEKGEVLWDANESLARIFFPHSGLISIAMPGEHGHRIEVGSVGPEGAAGLHAISPDTASPTAATVQIPGVFATVPARQLREASRQSEEIAGLVELGCGWLLHQAQQIAACNAMHSADGRLARWLLLATARTGSDMIPMIQEELAAMLGIRRTTATLLAQGLLNAGAIDYSRGKIMIRDRDKLEAAACPCRKALGPSHWPSTRLAALTARAPARRGLSPS